MFCKFFHERRFTIDGPGDSRGFSLIELAIVIAIVGIMGGIGYPPLMKIRANTRTRGVASDIFSSFRHARAEAVKRNVNVCLELTAPGTYKAFLDDGGDPKNCIQDADEPTTLFTKKVEPGTSIVASFKTGYTPRGTAYHPPLSTGSVIVQNDSNPGLQYKIALAVTGRVDIKASTDGGVTWK